MTLLFMDGFDHYTTPFIEKKGWDITNGSPTINTTGGRKSGGCCNLYYLDELTYQVGGVGGKRYTIGFALKFNTMPNSALRYLFRAYNDTGGSYMHIWAGNDGHIEIWNNTVPGEIYNSGTGFYTTGVWYYVEVQIEFLNSSQGYIGVKWDEDFLVDRTADNVWTGSSVLQFLRIIGTSYGSGIDIDDAYVLTEDGSINNDFLGRVRVDTIHPNAAGNYSQFVNTGAGANYQDVDDAQIAGDDYIRENANGKIDTYAFPDLDSAIKDDIAGVQVNMAGMKTGSNNHQCRSVIRKGGTDYNGTTQNLVQGDINVEREVQETDPSDSSAWNKSKVNACEFGVELLNS